MVDYFSFTSSLHLFNSLPSWTDVYEGISRTIGYNVARSCCNHHIVKNELFTKSYKHISTVLYRYRTRNMSLKHVRRNKTDQTTHLTLLMCT